MKTLSGLLIGLALLSTVAMTAEAQAECRATSNVPTYPEGKIIQQTCDLNGNLLTTSSGGGSSAVTATATDAAPTYVEGSTTSPLSMTLKGGLRTEEQNNQAGDDQANNMKMVGAGITRQITVFGGPAIAAVDATNPTQLIPSGPKTFQEILTCTGTCTQTTKIYGSSINSAVVATSELLVTLTLNGTTTTQASQSVTSNWMFYFAVTTGTGGTTPLATLYVNF